ncbi:hypothetical protein DICPUDRAFT_26332 [Dictyostelium purpureum]|uniref:mannose-6-phosphate isomerase n=1 Tax=Dictyostelium purpureum TaxID=5786 RepID=F0Z8K8_DICPU|nr:uncharacterized protein DICPUDRAFT_26332 [Dictyostelium purpureum]EGC39745.1 hypothetical protein DICPUDRAFT_26332 [Dictyostelium purpureum]|eukprot:XP_003283731.1 hypothetical protein DICPUDRAFT_26332 [Dictyostelium purpureum]
MSQIIVPLKCTSQNYEWGKFGTNSTVAQLLKGYAKECSNIIDDNKTYAELWMGSHPSAPSKVVCNNSQNQQEEINLNDYIEREQKLNHSSCIRGEIVEKRFGKDFPFLFKVLSIRTALSIQAHPDSQLAQVLFKKFPNIYKDPYHKPEIAVATTPFEALCGFRPLNEIQNFIETIPELNRSLPNLNKLDDCKEYLKSIVTILLKADSELIKNNLHHLKERLSKLDNPSDLDRLVLKLYSQYPGDVGVFFAYILNYLILKPGQAMFLAAGEPHAYISGDCIECMAPSDNVVRAGLTPKLKDVDTLAEMLTYSTGKPGLVDPITNPSISSENYLSYVPPVDEFQVDYYHLTSKCPKLKANLSKGPSIALVLSGKVSFENQSKPQSNLSDLHTGSVLFIPSNTELQFSQNDSNIPVSIFIATVNNKIFNKNNL